MGTQPETATASIRSVATPEGTDRERAIVRASLVGIAGNLLLVAFKLVVGLASRSIAIVLDAVNNATDVLSSVVTIVGTKLSLKRADRRHPFGYGRVEYLSSVAIAVIIIAAGVVSLRESIDKIVHPGAPSYSDVTIAVIVVAIFVKVALGVWFRRSGEKNDSEALIASGIDSNYDAVLSAGTLAVAFAQNLWGLNIDGAVGLVISLIVCKAGIDVMRDALDPIIGVPDDQRLVKDILSYVESYDEVNGVCDLVLDDFGPNERIGMMHIEVPDDMTARQIHELTRKIALDLEESCHVTAIIGIYAENTTGRYAQMRACLEEAVRAHPEVLQAHGFYVDEERATCFFDLVMDFDADGSRVAQEVIAFMRERYPAYDYSVETDTDFER